MFNRVKKLVGHRQTLANNGCDTVEIFIWHHPFYTPNHHVALRVIHGDILHYLSISPAQPANYSGSGLLGLRRGIPAYFIERYEDELLIQGFRQGWQDLQNTWPQTPKYQNLFEQMLTMLPQDMREQFRNNNLSKLPEKIILALANQLPISTQIYLQGKGHPQYSIKLYSLNTISMIKKIEQIKSFTTNAHYALWSGITNVSSAKYNCASATLQVLNAGGIAHLSQSNQDLIMLAGTMLGIIYAYAKRHSWQKSISDMLISMLLSRSLCGAMQGNIEIQTFLNYTALKGKNSKCSTITFRILSITLASFIGIFKSGPIVPHLITLPTDILKIAMSAKEEEDARFMPARLKLPTSTDSFIKTGPK